MKFFRTELPLSAARARNELGIGGKLLTCCSTRQQFEKDRERFPIGNDFINTHYSNM